MAIMLALGAAAFYGSADFVGGLASRRSPALTVAFGAQAAGLLVLLVAITMLGPSAVTRPDLAAGAASGVFGGVGIVLLYRALAVGPMSIVAPTSALSAASVPVLAGLALGERPGPTALAGIAMAFGAVWLITRERSAAGVVPKVRSAALVPALLGGSLFGLFFVFQHQAGAAAGLWPLVAARAVSLPLLAVLLVRSATPFPAGRGLFVPVLVSGSFDMAANILFLLATRHGILAVVAALTGLYPATTVLLAQRRLGETLQRPQVAGLAAAAVAAVLVAA